MIAALLSLLGGGTFRLLMGELVSWLKQRQDQAQEIALLRLQGELAAAEHNRNLDAIRLQAQLGVKTIEVKRDHDVAVAEADAFRAAVADAMKPSGIRWVDAWNAAVRPAFATAALLLWALALARQGFQLTEWDQALMGVVIGFFFADRSLRKAGR